MRGAGRVKTRSLVREARKREGMHDLMQDHDLKKSLWDVAQAFDRVNRAFEGHLRELKEGGGDPARVRHATEAVRAMRDSGSMYLAWAYHYAGIPLSEKAADP